MNTVLRERETKGDSQGRPQRGGDMEVEAWFYVTVWAMPAWQPHAEGFPPELSDNNPPRLLSLLYPSISCVLAFALLFFLHHFFNPSHLHLSSPTATHPLGLSLGTFLHPGSQKARGYLLCQTRWVMCRVMCKPTPTPVSWWTVKEGGGQALRREGRPQTPELTLTW